MTKHSLQSRVHFSCPAHALCAAALALALASNALPVQAQSAENFLLEGVGNTQTYILQLSGTVLNERFSGVTMTLQVSGPPPGSPHPCLVILAGFPDAQTRNAFFWNSGHSAMKTDANSLTCTFKPGSNPGQSIHFFYLSPALLKSTKRTHMQKEDLQRALKNAVPSMVAAQAGELKMTIRAGTVSGTVWLQGYDRVEKSYVRYSAAFSGRRALHIEQKAQPAHR